MRSALVLILLVPACAGAGPDTSSATTTVELGRAHAWLEFPAQGDPIRKRLGNNTRYAFDLRPLDDGADHTLDYRFTINGYDVSGLLHGTFRR